MIYYLAMIVRFLANKKQMIDTAKIKYDYPGDDDNEADAIHMRYLAKEELEI